MRFQLDLHEDVQMHKEEGSITSDGRITSTSKDFLAPLPSRTVSAIMSFELETMCRLPMTSNQGSKAIGRLKLAVIILLQRLNNIRAPTRRRERIEWCWEDLGC